MKRIDRSKIISYYSGLLRQYGPTDAKSLSWVGRNTQEARFEILLKLGDFTSKSVLDVGCGLGDLYCFLSKEYKHFEYIGIDINTKTIQCAKNKYPSINFVAKDFSTFKGVKVDYVLSSGSLTFKIDKYKDIYFKQIKKMFDLSKIAVGFNMLNAEKCTYDDLLVSYKIIEVVNYCKKFTKQIEVVQGYLENDFTVFLRH